MRELRGNSTARIEVAGNATRGIHRYQRPAHREALAATFLSCRTCAGDRTPVMCNLFTTDTAEEKDAQLSGVKKTSLLDRCKCLWQHAVIRRVRADNGRHRRLLATNACATINVGHSMGSVGHVKRVARSARCHALRGGRRSGGGRRFRSGRAEFLPPGPFCTLQKAAPGLESARRGDER